MTAIWAILVRHDIPLCEQNKWLRRLILAGSILLAFFSILASLFLIWRSERKKAAVGRRYDIKIQVKLTGNLLTGVHFREIQLFLAIFIVVEICEIFTVGGFPLHDAVRKVGPNILFFRVERLF